VGRAMLPRLAGRGTVPAMASSAPPSMACRCSTLLGVDPVAHDHGLVLCQVRALPGLGGDG